MTTHTELLKRIAELRDICRETGEFYREDLLKKLLRFFEINDKLSIPSRITISSGNFRAIWEDDYYHDFSIEFCGDGTIHGVIKSICGETFVF